MDEDLQNDVVKLVRYQVLFTKRDCEHAFSEREDLVSETTNEAAYVACKIAEFILEVGQGKTAIPVKWLEKDYPPSEYVRDGQLVGIPDEDKRHLRVHYEVLRQYVYEKYENDEQVRVLEEIKAAISEK